MREKFSSTRAVSSEPAHSKKVRWRLSLGCGEGIQTAGVFRGQAEVERRVMEDSSPPRSISLAVDHAHGLVMLTESPCGWPETMTFPEGEKSPLTTDPQWNSNQHWVQVFVFFHSLFVPRHYHFGH